MKNFLLFEIIFYKILLKIQITKNNERTTFFFKISFIFFFILTLQ